MSPYFDCAMHVTHGRLLCNMWGQAFQSDRLEMLRSSKVNRHIPLAPSRILDAPGMPLVRTTLATRRRRRSHASFC